MPRGVALPTAAPVARAPARVDGLGRRWRARSITDVVPFLRRRFRQVDDCFQMVEKHVGEGAAALWVYPRRTYPRRFRAWHDPPCLGSRGGCRLQGVRLSLRTEGRSPICLARLAARPAERRSWVRIAASWASGAHSLPEVSGHWTPLSSSTRIPSSGNAAARTKVFRCPMTGAGMTEGPIVAT